MEKYRENGKKNVEVRQTLTIGIGILYLDMKSGVYVVYISKFVC